MCMIWNNVTNDKLIDCCRNEAVVFHDLVVQKSLLCLFIFWPGVCFCGFCVLCSGISATLHCSNMHRVCHHSWFFSALPTETQQTVHCLLLATYCKQQSNPLDWLNELVLLIFCSACIVHRTLSIYTCKLLPQTNALLLSQDVFNSLFAAAFMFILSLVAVSTFTVKGTLSGGVRNTTSCIPVTLFIATA